MKKSIIVMMVAVLLVSALFVSCKQEIATPQDKLGTVSIALPSSRALTPTSESTVPTVDHWYYVATKTDGGYYKTGETEWASLAAMQAEQQVGTTFSAGEWSFSFYGFNGEAAKTQKANAIYYAENIPLTVVAKEGANYIDVVLQGGSAIPAANVTFGPLMFGNSTLPGSYVVKINGVAAEFDSQGKCKFTNVAEGDHTYVVTVWTTSGEKIGEAAPVTITVNKGYDYFISGSVETLDAVGIVKIRDVGYDKGVSASVSAVAGVPTDFVVENVAPVAGKDTSVSFAADDLVADSTYVLETAVKGIEDPSFVVTGDNVTVASIDLTLYKDGAQTTVSGKTVTVTTYIAKGLTDVKVSYDGTVYPSADVTYVKETGALTFVTSHFSSFDVESRSVAYIAETNTAYDTLEAAVTAAAPGQVIKLLKDVVLAEQLWIGKTLTLDLNGKTISVSTPSTNGVIGVLRGGDLTVKDSAGNGMIDGSIGGTAYAGIGLTRKGEAADGAVARLTVNGGTIKGVYYAITGNGTRHNTEIVINGGSIVGGSASEAGPGIYQPQDGILTVNGGTITGSENGIEIRAGKLVVNNGTISSTASTYNVVPNGSGTTTTGAGIAIAQHSTKKDISVNIMGGTITGQAAVSIAKPQGQTEQDGKISLSVKNADLTSAGSNYQIMEWGIGMENVTIDADGYTPFGSTITGGGEGASGFQPGPSLWD